MTTLLFREDPYLKECKASVTGITERNGILLDNTIFYPSGGGQPGDSGELQFADSNIKISTTITDRDSAEILHLPEEGQKLPQVGQSVVLTLDWQRRYRHMRMHSALHLLCALVPCGVTGGQIGELKSRLDFDVGETTLDKADLTEKLNQLIKADHPLSSYWITDDELDKAPELVRTMSVQPPRNSGKVRLIKVGEDIDLQPCGGTHVNKTGEIGRVKVSKIENKGKRNRRVNIVFDED